VKLRSHLLLLSIATAAPVVVLAIVIAVVVVKQERDTLRDVEGDRVVAVMSAIDAELRGSIATLRALAASSHLETGNLGAFHAEARRILASHPDWLNFTLARPDGCTRRSHSAVTTCAKRATARARSPSPPNPVRTWR
jgi:sensor domain CHASE-containing protein